MKRLIEELRIVSPVAWGIAVLVYCGLAALLFPVTANDTDIAHWPSLAIWLFVLCMPLIVAIYVVLVGYVHADARRRGMRYVMWTLLAIFVPNALGIILYFVLRDPLMIPCSSCAVQIRPGFAFCPSCGAALANVCPGCRKPVDAHWSHCVACGTKIS